MNQEHCTTYLNDHLAGSAIALEVLDQLAAEAADLAPYLAGLKAEIEADRRILQSLMTGLGIAESRVRKLGSWISEQIVDIKMEADDDPGGPLRRLERLEALAVGVDGKLALWLALQAAAATDPSFSALPYETLLGRAVSQRRQLEELRVKAAVAALVPGQARSAGE